MADEEKDPAGWGPMQGTVTIPWQDYDRITARLANLSASIEHLGERLRALEARLTETTHEQGSSTDD